MTTLVYDFTQSSLSNHFIDVQIYWSYDNNVYINPHTLWPYRDYDKRYTVDRADFEIPRSLDYGTNYNLTIFNCTRATLIGYYFVDPLTIRLVSTIRYQYGYLHSIFDVPSKLYFSLTK